MCSPGELVIPTWHFSSTPKSRPTFWKFPPLGFPLWLHFLKFPPWIAFFYMISKYCSCGPSLNLPPHLGFKILHNLSSAFLIAFLMPTKNTSFMLHVDYLIASCLHCAGSHCWNLAQHSFSWNVKMPPFWLFILPILQILDLPGPGWGFPPNVLVHSNISCLQIAPPVRMSFFLHTHSTFYSWCAGLSSLRAETRYYFICVPVPQSIFTFKRGCHQML